MIRVLQSLLALTCLLLLIFLASRAQSAEWQEPDFVDQSASSVPRPSSHARPMHRCLTPAVQPGTHLQGQPFAYGYFGAHARPVSVYQQSFHADWFQWTFLRAD
jgi:hypothetical protein